MEFGSLLNEVEVDALWALLACLGLAFISGRIQNKDANEKIYFKIGEVVLFKSDGIKGRVVGVKRSGMVRIEIDGREDRCWCRQELLDKA